mmetsp:Transcript_7671/g.8801  ORF Transcript_7671/g.8801 Transcript_7671/m.8801 type:complete len:463 (+) Transcript_7671:112-1500(+)
MGSQLENVVENLSKRLEIVEQKLGLTDGKLASAEQAETEMPGSGSQTSEAIVGFDNYIVKAIDPFVSTSVEIGENVALLGKTVKETVEEVRNFLVKASCISKPGKEDLNLLLTPISEKMLTLQGLDQRLEYKNHVKAVCEGAPSFIWVNPEIKTPVAHVEAFKDASVFWVNKIRRDFKQKPDGALHMKWCEQLIEAFQGLYDFVKAHCKMGVQWNVNPKAGMVKSVTVVEKQSPLKQSNGGLQNVFKELSKIDQSSGKTAGLRHVTKDMKSKNNLKQPAAKIAKPVSGSTRKAKIQTKKQPVFALQGMKWSIDYQVNCTKTIEASEIDKRKTVYIHGCEGATIIVKGKCNTITIDNCKKTNVVFESVLATCEIVNSKSVKVQCNENAPTLSIDKTDGITIYIMKRDVIKNVKFVTAKSSEMNVSFPSADAEGDFIESALPEQYVHIIEKDKVSTSVSDLYSH